MPLAFSSPQLMKSLASMDKQAKTKVLRRMYFSGAFSTIDEILDSTPPTSSEFDKTQAETRLKAWCDVAAAGDDFLFRDLLQARGLTYETVHRKLGEQHLISGQLPSWLETLINTIDASLHNWQSFSPSESRAHTRPFGYISEVLATSAESLRDQSLRKEDLERFSPRARSDLRTCLCDQIESLIAAPLYQSFRGWLMADGKERASVFSEQKRTFGVDESHGQFLKYFLDEGFDSLWLQSPVLALSLGNTLEQWIAFTTELIERYSFCQRKIKDFVGSDQDGLTVENVSCGLSDMHNSGRSVCVLSLLGTSRLVYKPRSVSSEAAWERFIEGINALIPAVKLRSMRVLDCHGYGWCEFVEGPSNIDEVQAELFFHRAGILLGLLHLLAAADMHEENLVAFGAHPVPVDLEMLLQPSIKNKVTTGENPLSALFLARDIVADSVLETGLLPMIVKTPETATIGQGGLSHHTLFGPRKLGWQHVNTVDMMPTLESGTRLHLCNLPMVSGSSARLHVHWEPFKRGVEEALRLALRHKKDFLRRGGLLEPFKGIPIRITLRPTRYYEMLLRRLADFRKMSDVQTWSLQADFSSRFEFSPDQPAWPTSYTKRERRDLLSMNVPHFEIASDGFLNYELKSDLDCASQGNYISGFERVSLRIAQLDESHIQAQLKILELSALAFTDKRTPEVVHEGNTSLGQRFRAVDVAPHGSAESLFRDEIRRISGLLKQSAIRKGGGASWLGLTPVGDTDAIALRPLGQGLYDGSMGVAMFLAAAAVLLEDEESKLLCLDALATTDSYLKNASAAGFARTMGMGGTEGIGSLIYGFASIARILSMPALLENALGASRLITDRMIDGDRTFDISRGSAGTILALMRLHADTQDKAVLSRAVDCAEHLLRHRPHHLGAIWKRNREPVALTGMSHGASGYALAFHRLYLATKDSRYQQIVRDCLAYERSVFSQEKQNWPDLRPNDQDRHAEFPVRWCHGAAGIAFVRRVLIDGKYDDPTLDLEYQVAREAVNNFGWHQNDSLCCGNFGSIALLTRPAIAAPGGASSHHADEQLQKLILQARGAGSYQWQGGRDDHNPGMFRGISGIGYTIARRLTDGILPDVLTLS